MGHRRILFLLPDLRNPAYKGGIQMFNNYVHRAITELGHDVSVIGVNDRPEDAEPGLIPCNRWRRTRKVVAALQLIWQIAFHHPDVVLCGHLNFAALCRRVCGWFGVRYITITHGIELWDAPASKVRGAAGSHRILAVSRYTKSLNLDLLDGYDPDHVVVFPNTFDEERFKPSPVPTDLRSRLGLNASDRIVLSVGRLASTERLKGYDEAILAVAEVRKVMPEVRLVLGGRGDDMDRLRQVADGCGLGDGLVMPGFIAEEDIVSLFNLCDLFVLPSRKEGFGIVFLEAMGCGKPVIGGNRDGSMDPLCDGTLGAAVDPENVDAIAAAMTELLRGTAPATRSDPAHLRREVVDKFGFARFRDRLAAVLDMV
ncbi:MAG: glycosyltransferase family 4 protein [Phycisphaerales bacterium]|jgi:glycosyltransferase involved in cell wall biosynthesis|nr:glycosyltransferase family 4 protein [Phycisphaerales bacterium]